MIKDLETLADITMIQEFASLTDEAVKKIQIKNFLRINADAELILFKQMGLLESNQQTDEEDLV